MSQVASQSSYRSSSEMHSASATKKPAERARILTHKSSKCDWAAELLVALSLFFMPLALGTVDGWSQLVANCLICAAFVCILIRPIVSPELRWVRTKAYLPIALFIGLIAIQLLPLPPKLLEMISPEGYRLRSKLLGDLPGAADEYWPISLYPHGTMVALRAVVVASMMYFVVVNTYRRSAQVKRLLAVIAGSGFVVALLAIAQNISQADSIFWSIKIGRAWSGPYVNHNNFAQFMNLSIGAAFGLLLVLVREGELSRKRTVHSFLQGLQRVRLRMLLWLLATIILGAVSVFMSGSRGGMLSLVGGIAFAGVTLAASRQVPGRGWIAVLLVLGVFCGLLYAGFDAVYLRLSTLQDLQGAAQARWEDNRDAWAVAKQYLGSGIGLGTHEVVFPGYAKGLFRDLGIYLENEYLQLVEEMGLPGVIAVGAFFWIIATYFVQSARSTSLPVYTAACGIGFALVAVLIGSITDFGQRVTSVTCLTAATMGLMAVLGMRASVEEQQDHVTSPTHSLRNKVMFGSMSFVGLLVAVWVVFGSAKTASAESAWAMVEAENQAIMAAGADVKPTDFVHLLEAANVAAAAEPSNVHYAYWLNAFRWQVVTFNLTQLNGQALPAEVRQHLSSLLHAFNEVRQLAPTFGPPYCVVGQVQQWLGENDAGRQNVEIAQTLTPSDATVCFVAGRQAGQSQDYQLATSLLKRAVNLGYAQNAVIGLFEVTFKRPELMAEVFDDNPNALRLLALRYATASPGLASKFRNRAIDLLEVGDKEGSPSATERMQLGDLLAEAGRIEDAVEQFKLATLQEPGNIKYRLRFGKMLLFLGRNEDAAREAKICLRYRPKWSEAEQLLREINAAAQSPGQITK